MAQERQYRLSGATRIVPTDPIADVFTPERLGRLHGLATKSDDLVARLSVLAARPSSVDPEAARIIAHPAYRRAERSAWETYLHAAFALGLFDDPHGSDLRARLTGDDDDAFRGALAECMVGWLLAGKLKLSIDVRPEGRPGHLLEYLIHHASGDIRVEVKAPHRPLPPSSAWYGDDSDLLAGALKRANEQFDSGVRNLLVVVPSIRMPVYRDRGQLARALYGQPVFTMPIDVAKGEAVGPTTIELQSDGRFLSTRNPKGRLLKPDGTPAYTRVGAVLCVEEELQFANAPWMDHKILLAHNPHAADRIPNDIWGDRIPQFLEVGGEMAWDDGAPTF